VAELWLVDSPARTILVLRRSSEASADFDVTVEVSGGETLRTPLLEGFELAGAELFD
jgi:Uma2 family endonuclease